MKKHSIESMGFDELFKTQMKDYFEKFAKVITDYEILDLPRKADILVIEEAGQKISDHVSVFTYFKKINIIEFKSARDSFSMNTDFHKIYVYTGGVMEKEKEATPENTTFTLVIARRPSKLLFKYEKNVQKLRNGVYLIENINSIGIYVVVIEELEIDFTNELGILKEYSSKKDIEIYVKELCHRFKMNDNDFEQLFYYAIALYEDLVEKLATQEGINMTVVEKNINKWADKFGLKDKYISEGEMRATISNAKKMIKKGMDTDTISEITGLSKKDIEKLRDEK
ncbi:MAG: hypothetical protein MJB14_01740 [Spirochaetes bacterium]|nr:hypothetical protein [Spirochaetota bacterium]